MPAEPPLVLHAVNSYLFRTGPWIDTQIRNLGGYRCAVLAKRRENPDLFTFEPVRAFSDLSRAERLRQKTARALRKRRIWPVYRRWLEELRPSVVHAHFGPVGWELGADCRDLGVPLVTSFYGYDLGRLAREEPWRSRYRALFEEGDLFLVEGSAFRDALLAAGCPPEKAAVQPLGVDVGAIPFRPPREGPARAVLFCGSFREKKGLPTAVRAFARAARTTPDLELWIVGGGTGGEERRQEAEARDAVARHGLEARVRFLGYLDHSSLIRAFGDVDLFLAPSRTAADGDNEGGAPVVLIEAHAAGLPAVATRHCDIPEIVSDGETGLLAGEEDVDALGDAISRLALDADLRARFGRAARERVEARFDLKPILARLEEHYTRLRSGDRGTRRASRA